MAKQTIGIGSSANDGTGDALRDAFDKCNDNFTELYDGSWTYVILGSDFTTGNTSNDTVTGLNFTPAASTRYIIEGYFMVRTATTTVGARPGVSWPTGYDDGASYLQVPNSATALALQNSNPAAGTANAASTGLPNTGRSFHCQLQALLLMGASPSGNFQITLASETAATNVTMRAGSFIRYRAY